MCCTWIFTVVSAMSRARAISLLLAPRAISRSTSSSRGDSCGAGSASSGAGSGSGAPWDWKAATSLPIISGLTTGSPLAARRTAWASRSPSMVLSR